MTTPDASLIQQTFTPTGRPLRTERHDADLVVVGGGLAGACSAITAAREGLRVVLVQDRPVLGGNASSEVRLWTLGATCHMGANQRWAREGGVINELLVENWYRNPQGNPLIFDTVLLELASNEPNLTLLLNTAAYEVHKTDDAGDRIASVRAFCSQNSTVYDLHAPLFCDASGDGIVGFAAGAPFRMGAEGRDVYGEAFAPTGDFGHLLGHSIYFYSKDAGKPVGFTPPAFALENVPERIPRYRSFNTKKQGCQLWWIEWGGRLDTVHESETIKWELWRIVYGVWDYIKNSGKFPEAANLTLEWVGHVPGKRESRRFLGDYTLTQQDIVERRRHDDAVAFGGWSIDLHPADGVFAEVAGSHHLHARGPYGIPYRCYYSQGIRNLFFAGRIISSSHVAFGSTRVMATCAHGGQAVAVAAAECLRQGVDPADLTDPERLKPYRTRLARTGQHFWGDAVADPLDLATTATVTASSQFRLDHLPPDGSSLNLLHPLAQLIPLPAGPAPTFGLSVIAERATTLRAELRTTSRPDHHTPDTLLAKATADVPGNGEHEITLDFKTEMPRNGYGFLVLYPDNNLWIRQTNRRVTGLLTLERRGRREQSHIGGEDFDVWKPQRRPAGKNLALRFDPPIGQPFDPSHIQSPVFRPTDQPNAWIADPDDDSPSLTLKWDTPQTFQRIDLFFDVDYDHALESVLMEHPENASPFCVASFTVDDGRGHTLYNTDGNHQAHRIIRLPDPLTTDTLRVTLGKPHGPSPAALFAVRAFA